MAERRVGVVHLGDRAAVGLQPDCQLAPATQCGGRIGLGERQLGYQRLSVDRMQAELEFGDDPEVAAAAA